MAIRGLLMAVAVLFAYIAWLGTTAIAILQFIVTAVRGEPVEDLKHAADWLKAYTNRLYSFLSFDTETFPLPGEDERKS